MTRIHVVLNGSAAAPADLEPALGVLRDEGHEIALEVTEGPGDAAEMAAAAVGAGAEAVVAAGGDGTVSEVASGLLRAGEPNAARLGVLPLGTANDFAAACMIPCNDRLAALRLVVDTEPRAIDIGLMNGRPFVNMASGGFGSEVTAETPPELKRSLGGLSYLLTGLRQFNQFAAERGRAKGPDFEWDGEFVALAVGNGRRAGGGITLCPAAQLNDGFLDVMILPEPPEGQRLETLLSLLRDGLTAEGSAIYAQVEELEFSVPSGLHVNLDGEPTEATALQFRVRPEALRVHLPDGAPLRRTGGD